VVAEEFEIDAEINGERARELNRSILSELRHACRRTSIRPGTALSAVARPADMATRAGRTLIPGPLRRVEAAPRG
jgi:hypothetical protein